ncbi:MAG: 3-hydroxyacyl-CoA dehydrogenase [Pseudomonadota bacterium]
MDTQVACIGVGNVGRAWAIAFARGGHRVRLFDTEQTALERSLVQIATSLDDLQSALLVDDADAILARIDTCASMEQALTGTDHVQESVIEDIEIKRQLFAEMDALAAPGCVLASSSSEFMSSEFVGDTKNPQRCLVAHPFNPPHLIPLVEICGHPGTDPSVVQRTRELFERIGMSPVVVNREVKAFLLNRLQAAVVGEAMHLVGEGYCSAEDLDRAMSDGLGLRWSFMGPFMTGHLNASGGYREYMRTFGDTYRRMCADLSTNYPFDLQLIDRVSGDMEKTFPADRIAEGQRWRDQRLIDLLRHKQTAAAPATDTDA